MCPVFDLESRQPGKIREIPRQESGIVDEDDGGDFKIHRPQTPEGSAKTLEFCCRARIEFEYWDGPIVIKMSLEASVGFNLLSERPHPREVGEPTPHLFLEIDDCCHGFIWTELGQTRQQFSGRRISLPFQGTKMIGVEHDHAEILVI